MSCGCKLCKEKYPTPERRSRKDCVGPWQARWRNAAGKQDTKCFRTETEAKNHLIATVAAIKAGTYIDPDLGKEALQDFRKRWRKAQGGEPSTLDRDDRMWANHIQPRWGGFPIAGILHLDYQAWITHGLKSDLAPGSIVKVHQIMDRMLAAAFRERRIVFNPCDGIKLPSVPKKHPEERRPPSAFQLDCVRDCLPRYLRPLEVFLEETGVRFGEAVGLRLCYVDRVRKRVTIKEVLSEVNGKLIRKEYPKSEAGLRTIGLSTRAEAAIDEVMEFYSVSDAKTTVAEGMCEKELIFRGRNGKPIRRNSFRRPWIAAIQEAGVARRTVDRHTGHVDWWPTPHHIRHYYASVLADIGVPEVVTQEILGHERGGDVTWLYTHAASDVAGQVLAALADASKAKPGPHLRVAS
ncbi:tyrosine-type recombinase/integrase [Yinghuangia sp. YIM S09857]|uniref:tyrosine-type recombinase/integrase n=1 Tax=Yinghuangia sp. YIM S09857 TaxID=3436929 RepID=UPI003F531D63